MSNQAARTAKNARYQLRAARQKTAALLMPFFLDREYVTEMGFRKAAQNAVAAADILLDEILRTEKKEEPCKATS